MLKQPLCDDMFIECDFILTVYNEFCVYRLFLIGQVCPDNKLHTYDIVKDE